MTEPEEILSKSGLFVDDLNHLRLLSTETSECCTELSQEGKNFEQQMAQFKTTTESLITTMEELATMVETEKLRAMTSRSILKNIDKRKVNETQQIQILIREKQVELERLRIELEAAQKMEQDQRDFIQQFISN
ncbi:unnamed protein product, partial [Mesorhabditis belari]|uniref:Intraflagellar transport protein 20 n=1 Tax=Mesorhabditis belari TaxID=2138241 RepID=A0AAF3EDA8_9BILA